MQLLLEFLVIGVNLAVIVGVALLILAVRKMDKQRQLGTSNPQQIKQKPYSKEIIEPVSEQKRAVQLVHDGLENVLRHLSSIECHRPEMIMAEISAGNRQVNSEVKHCPSCNAPWDNAFDFCLKCSHPAQ